MKILNGDCIEAMAELDPDSIDAIVCDPPYGLEFMGKQWDRLDGWRDGGGLTKPGIGERQTDWPSFGGETANPTCATCGGRARGENRCGCDVPEWRVKGEPFNPIARSASRNRAMQDWHLAWATEALRILKPGGHLLAFGGTRTYHRLACAVEDAGFEIRDSILWVYGSGFPKSLDVSKAIDKAAGAEREVVGLADRKASLRSRGVLGASNEGEPPLISSPATPEAQRWEGWGTALKPAHEPIVVARKPLAGTVAANVLQFGTGALNIDGCRVGYEPGDPYGHNGMVPISGGEVAPVNPAGRWPANCILSEQAAEELDRQSGELTSGANPERRGVDGDRTTYGDFNGQDDANPQRGLDRGGASRFFYCAKASRAERNAGLGGFPAEHSPDDGYGSIQTPKLDRATPRENWTPHRVANSHPTVKPIDLMRWLVRLVTPPGGTCLDPFLGSGTTGAAAVLEGFDFIGIEREAEYAAIAEARIKFWAQFPGADVDAVLVSDARAREIEATGQMGLLMEEAA